MGMGGGTRLDRQHQLAHRQHFKDNYNYWLRFLMGRLFFRKEAI